MVALNERNVVQCLVRTEWDGNGNDTVIDVWICASLPGTQDVFVSRGSLLQGGKVRFGVTSCVAIRIRLFRLYNRLCARGYNSTDLFWVKRNYPDFYDRLDKEYAWAIVRS